MRPGELCPCPFCHLFLIMGTSSQKEEIFAPGSKSDPTSFIDLAIEASVQDKEVNVSIGWILSRSRGSVNALSFRHHEEEQDEGFMQSSSLPISLVLGLVCDSRLGYQGNGCPILLGANHP